MDIYHLSNLHILNIVLNCKKTKNAKACRRLLSSRCIKTLIANAGSWHPALVKFDLKHIACTILKLSHRLFVVDKSWVETDWNAIYSCGVQWHIIDKVFWKSVSWQALVIWKPDPRDSQTIPFNTKPPLYVQDIFWDKSVLSPEVHHQPILCKTFFWDDSPSCNLILDDSKKNLILGWQAKRPPHFRQWSLSIFAPFLNNIPISVSISTFLKPEATFSLTKDVNRTQKRSFLEVTLHRSEGATHNDAWDAQWCSVYRQQYHQYTPSQWNSGWILQERWSC